MIGCATRTTNGILIVREWDGCICKEGRKGKPVYNLFRYLIIFISIIWPLLRALPIPQLIVSLFLEPISLQKQQMFNILITHSLLFPLLHESLISFTYFQFNFNFCGSITHHTQWQKIGRVAHVLLCNILIHICMKRYPTVVWAFLEGGSLVSPAAHQNPWAPLKWSANAKLTTMSMEWNMWMCPFLLYIRRRSSRLHKGFL